MDESWPEYDSTPPRERVRRGPDPLEQGLDRLVSAGRHLIRFHLGQDVVGGLNQLVEALS